IVARRLAGNVLGAETFKERPNESGKIRIGFGRLLAVRLEMTEEKFTVAIKPALALNKVKKQEAIENRLPLGFDDFVRPFVPALQVCADEIVSLAEVDEELLVELFDGEGSDDILQGRRVALAGQLF